MSGNKFHVELSKEYWSTVNSFVVGMAVLPQLEESLGVTAVNEGGLITKAAEPTVYVLFVTEPVFVTVGVELVCAYSQLTILLVG